VESKTIKVTSNPFKRGDSRLHVHSNDGRASSYLRTLKRAVKFLLFREDDPKHEVAKDLQPIHLAVLLPLPVGLVAISILVGFMYYGATGALAAYLSVCLLVLEIPHCIFDR